MDVFDLAAKITLDTSGYESSLNDAEKKGESFQSKLGGGLKTAAKVGVGAVTAVAGATAAMGGALVKGAGNVAEYGDHIDKMSQKMGISAQAYQEWDAIAQHSGTSIDALKGAFKTMAKQAEDNSDAFQRLGISQEEVASLSQEDLFAKTIAGLQEMEEGTERTALASQLLGRGGMELGALLNTSAEDTEKMRQAVHDLGGVMSDDAVKASAAFQDQLQDMQTAFAGTKRNLMSDFLPSITTVMEGLTELFSGGDGMAKITEGINGIADKMSEAIPKLLDVGGRIVGALGEAILNNLPTLIESGTQTVLTLIQGLVSKLPDIVKAGMQILTTLIQGITQSIPSLIPAMVQAVIEMDKALIDNAPMLIEAALELIIALAEGLIDAIPQLIQAIPQIVQSIVTALTNNAPRLVVSALKLMIALAGGLIKAIPQVVRAIPQIIRALVSGLGAGIREMASAGANLVSGIWSGFVGRLSWIKAKISGWVGNVVGFIKGLFKIGSPSKLLADEVGQFLPQGIAVGIEANADSVYDQMDEMREKVAQPFDVSVVGDAKVSTTATTSTQNGSVQELVGILTMYLPMILEKIGADVYMDGRKVAEIVDEYLGEMTVERARAN